MMRSRPGTAHGMSDARILREIQFVQHVRDRKQAQADFLRWDEITALAARLGTTDLPNMRAELTRARTIYVRARMAEQRALNRLIADLEGEI